MAIYDKDGTLLASVYDADGDALDFAYDADGTVIYTREYSLKAMTYNVGGWYCGSGRNVPSAQKSEYLELQTGTIEENDPDVLFIQEYLANFSDDGTSALTMLQSMFPYVNAHTSGTYYGRAICSKYPITNYTVRTYTNDTNRYYDSCIITANGEQITLVNTHLGLTAEARQEQMVELLPFLQSIQTPFIMAGDFNTMQNETLDGDDYTNVINPLINAGFHLANCGDFGRIITFQNASGYDRSLDNIVCSSDITIEDAYVDTRKLTDSISDTVDHMPLIAELLLP